MDYTGLKATDEFYPGEQRISLIALDEVRLPLILFGAFSIIATLLFLKFGSKKGEIIDFANTLLFVFPLAIRLAGGASKKAWAAYAVFAAAAFAGMSGFSATSRTAFLALLIPAAAAFLLFHLSAPHVLRTFGLSEKSPLKKEIPIMLMVVIVLPLMFYHMTTAVSVLKPRNMTPGVSLYYLMTGIILYVPVFGICYGILTRRLLAMNFQLIIAIAINSVILSLYFMPNSLCHDRSAMVIIGVPLCVFGIQIVLGLGYYYARSTRFLLLGYLIFYLFYKTMGV